MIISEQEFRRLLELKLGPTWNRALAVFRNYGPNLAYDMTNVLLHAADKKKVDEVDEVDEVLDILEEHYQEHLQFQHPEIRGTVADLLSGVNPTQTMFLRICKQTLKLT